MIEPGPVTRSFARSRALQDRLHELVPGGAHTYARGSDQYPESMAPVLVRGRGCRVWDVDGNAYVEYGMGLRSVTLGHGYAPVVEAVTRAVADGVNFSRPTELEVAAAEDLLALVPAADMVKFAKNGSDVTTAAVRLARAVTGRTRVAVCRQPFFSTDDWFIGTTAMNRGIPAATRADTVRFDFNDLSSLAAVLAAGDVACVMLEAATALAKPHPGFLDGVRRLCDAHCALMVLDETITGFRWSAGGAQASYGVRPDLSCWGKAMANGFPLAALAGRREYMELGGLRTSGDRVFLLSTTHGPETASLAAFRAVVHAYRTQDPIGAMEAAGRQLAAQEFLQEQRAVRRRQAALGVPGGEQQTRRPADHLDVELEPRRGDGGGDLRRELPASRLHRADRILGAVGVHDGAERRERRGLRAMRRRQQEHPVTAGAQTAEFHVLTAPGQCRERKAVGHRLAPAGQVGPHPVAGLRPARRPPEAGDGLVEHHQRAVRVAQPPDALEEAGTRLGQCRRGLQHDAGDVPGGQHRGQ